MNTQPAVPGGNLSSGAEIVNPGQSGTPTPTPSPQTQTPRPPATVTEPAPDSTAAVPEVPSGEQQATVTFESQQGSLYKYTLSGGDKITVKLKVVNDKCWYGVSEAKGKKYVKEGTLKKDEEVVVELGKTAYIRLGKPTVVEMTVNGARVDTSNMKYMPSNVVVTMAPSVTQ
jgi:hypothetical protein